MTSVIPRQPKKDRDQITIKLDRDVLANLERYCQYIDSSRDYVINQCLVLIFRKDRPFTEWLASQGLPAQSAGSGDPMPSGEVSQIRRQASRTTAQARTSPAA